MTGARKCRPKPGLPVSALMLIKIRSDYRWTQRQLADELDVGRDTISRWERGQCQPPVYLMAHVRSLAAVG